MPGWPFRRRARRCRGLRGAEGQPIGGSGKVSTRWAVHPAPPTPSSPCAAAPSGPASRSSAPSRRPGSTFSPLTARPRCSSWRRASPWEDASCVRSSTGARSTPSARDSPGASVVHGTSAATAASASGDACPGVGAEEHVAGLLGRPGRRRPVHELGDLPREHPLGPPRGRGHRRAPRASASTSTMGRSVNCASIRRTSASSVLIQCWKKAYGEVRSGSSQTRAPVVLPTLVPSAAVISGQHSACTAAPRRRRIRSTPERMLPHWSEPPIWSSQPLGLVQVVVVVGLQQHVAELRVGDAVLARHPGLDALPGDHLVHGDVLADLAQEVEEVQVLGPGEVVDERPRPPRSPGSGRSGS